MTTYNNDEKIKEMNNIKECVSVILQLKKNYGNDYVHNNINNLYPFFIENYPTLYNIIMSTSDLKILNLMITTITNICENKGDADVLTKNIAETLANEYLYSKIGKPDK